MGYDYGAKLQIARARHKEGKIWRECAAVVGANEATVRLWDQHGDEEWRTAEEEVFAEIRREGRGVAWRGLVGAAGAGDVAACKAILDRSEGAVRQGLDLDGSITIEVPVVTLAAPQTGAADGADTDSA